MPANLSTEALLAQRRYENATTIEEKIDALDEFLSLIPKHKGTEKLRMTYKKKLAKLKATLEKTRQKRSGGGMTVKKEGAAQITLLGMTNSGKSTLLNLLTEAKATVAEYPYTTALPEIGMLKYKKVLIQIVELPAIVENFLDTERGPTILGLARNSDMSIFVVDLTDDPVYQLHTIMNVFEKAKIIVSRAKPDVKLEITQTGGIAIVGEEYIINTELGDVKRFLLERGIKNCVLKIKSPADLDDIKNSLDPRIKFHRVLVVGMKGDVSGSANGYNRLKKEFGKIFDICAVSPAHPETLDNVKESIWKSLRLIRIFTKTPGKPAEDRPVVLKKEATVEKVAREIHKSFLERFRFARIWGSSKFPGQKVGLDYRLEDGDIVEIHLKR